MLPKPLTKEEARELVEHEVGRGSLVILDDATLEREWGWVFFSDTRKFAETGDFQYGLLGLGPTFVNRFDGAVTHWGSGLPACAWIDVHERQLAGGGLRGWWRTKVAPRLAGRPARAPEPRMPASQDEADRVFSAWDRLNGRYFFLATVRLDDGRVLPRVTFDADTNIAVQVGDLDVRYRYDFVGRRVLDLTRL